MVLYQTVGVATVAAIHFVFLYMQMVVWQGPIGLKMFKLNSSNAKPFQTLAFQQGMYNGFLAAGLIGSLFLSDETSKLYGMTFFLVCVVIAGIVGGLTAFRNILYIQALPAVIALGLLWIS